VMDTWATSSLTPEIVCGWGEDDDLFGRTFPMDLRPQGHEIIRTWLFSSIVRAHFEFGALPWNHAALSGWVLDPDRKKMSKSKGNVTTPLDTLETYGSDAVRYWAASARPGTDTAFDEGQIKIGRKLAIKIINASRFALNIAGDVPDAGTAITNPLDRSMLIGLAAVVDEATSAFESYDYARALERTERFFWAFCDDYVELVKQRAYGSAGESEARSAALALRTALSTLLRLFAPFLPFVTEEVWSWWQSGSVHKASWPVAGALRLAEGDPLVFEVAGDVLGAVNKEKSEQKQSLASPVERVLVRDTDARLSALAEAEADVRAAGKIAILATEAGGDSIVKVELASAGS